MTCIMGGRKDDVKRTPKPLRKRPLSAVIEEHECEDFLPKANTENNDSLTHNNSNNEGAGSDVNPCRIHDGGDANISDATSSSVSCPPPPITVTITNERGKTDILTTSNSPRRNSLRSINNRRLALTPSAFSSKFGLRAGGSTLTSRLSHQSECSDSDDETLSQSDMTRLQQTADRLHLSTRRPSIMQWRAQFVERPEFPLAGNSGEDDVTGEQNGGDEKGRWTAERTQRINSALDWIINELQEMRTQDQQLARQLLTIRSELHELKLARSCEEHQDMLDDVQSDLEDLQEFADVLDLPVPTLIPDTPLKHLGVTRMNFSARRFSTC